jgi:hypothetical protein
LYIGNGWSNGRLNIGGISSSHVLTRVACKNRLDVHAWTVLALPAQWAVFDWICIEVMPIFLKQRWANPNGIPMPARIRATVGRGHDDG